jgi:hypothetical protein
MLLPLAYFTTGLVSFLYHFELVFMILVYQYVCKLFQLFVKVFSFYFSRHFLQLGLIKCYTYLHSCTCSIGLVYSTDLRTGNFLPLNGIFFVKILLKFDFTIYLFEFTEVSSSFAISSVTVLVSVFVCTIYS